MKDLYIKNQKSLYNAVRFPALLIAVAMLVASVSLLAGCKPKPTPTSEALSSQESTAVSDDQSMTEESSEAESSEEGSSEEPVSSQEQSSASSSAASAAASSSASSIAPTVTKAPTPTNAAATELFAEDFESGMDRWTTIEGTWAVVQDGTKALKQSNRDAWEAIATAGDTGWTDYTVTIRFKLHNGYFGLLGRVKDADNLYLFDLNELGYSVWCKSGGGYNHTLPDITFASISKPNLAVDQWHTAAITFAGNQITLFLNGQQLGDPINDNTIGNGRIGVRSSYGTFTIDDVTVE